MMSRDRTATELEGRRDLLQLGQETVAAHVRGKHLAQPPERACRGGRIQPVQYFPGAREPDDPVQGSGHVQAVVDGLMDVSEGDTAEPRSFQDRRHGRRIGE